MNIFEYFKKKGIDTIDSSFYSKIAMWDSWYRANVKRFHQYRVYHGTGQYERCHRKSLGMAKKICEDISDLLLNERVTITIKDETTAKFVRSRCCELHRAGQRVPGAQGCLWHRGLCPVSDQHGSGRRRQRPEC